MTDAAAEQPEGEGTEPGGPSPEEMCAEGLVPLAAAYAVDDGELRWVSCTEVPAFRMVQAATDDAVYVFEAPGQTVALAPDDGTVLVDAPPAPEGSGPAQDPSGSGAVQVDEFVVSGGQDDPVRVSGGNGSIAWSRPGVWVYDDVWAIDDGAVFAVEREGPRLVAYELASGDIRWEQQGDPYLDGLWPWLAEDGRLFTMWSNLQARDTATGELLWRTTYPRPTNPLLRMAGAATDGENVYVGFGTEASGGD